MAVLVTPLTESQEIGPAGSAGSVSSHVANVNVGRSNRLTRLDESALSESGGAYSWVEGEPWSTSDSHRIALQCTNETPLPCEVPKS